MGIESIVIDNGSDSCKAGFSGSDCPSVIVSTIVGNSANGDYTVGKRLYRNKYPIEKRMITDLENMEKIWTYIFKEISVKTKDHPILLTEGPLNPINNREKMAEIMFEKFDAPSIFIATQATLSLFSVGRTNGLVLDSGEITHVVPIYDGSILSHDVQRLDIGGGDITCYLMKLLTESGYSFTTTAEREIARNIKEKYSYISLQYEQTRNIHIPEIKEKIFTLPDGNEIKLRNELFKCPEILFQPHLFSMDCAGISEIMNNCCSKATDITIRKELFNNIVLAGGNTLFSGFKERLTKEIKSLAPTSFDIEVIDTPDRLYSAFNGGAILSSLDSFEDKWTTLEEYNESGPSIIHRKHF